MASTIASGLNKAQAALQSVSSKDKKTVDLSRDTVDVHTSEPQTTDHGVRIENPDNWLKVATDRQTGPSLLEDQIAREKVKALLIRN
jgi:catalase